ncbi:Lipoprotein [Flavobacterium longum]|uniref:DUF6146 family protein n=1 Tax=Flavobacterium longum TaxID=1299340 RepID=UPI0039EB9D59
MKTILYTVLVLVLVLACTSNKTLTSNPQPEKPIAQNDTVRIVNDSLEYEVIIIDAGFTSWLAGRAYPRNYYSQAYLEGKNRPWVFEWNIRARNPSVYGDLYLLPIDYNPGINYGYEVNYLLYNYLVYFQNKYNQRLGGRVPDR